LDSLAIKHAGHSGRFFSDFKRELKKQDFLKQIMQETKSEFYDLMNACENKTPVERDPRNVSDFADFVFDAEGITSAFYDSYKWARINRPKYSKWDALKAAKSCFARHTKLMLATDEKPFFQNYLFFQTINEQFNLGYSLRYIRDYAWQKSRPKFKPGKVPSRSGNSDQIREDYKRLLGIVSPPFEKQTGASRKKTIKKYPAIESAIDFVNRQLDESKQLDEDEFIDVCFKCRKARRVAIILTAHLHDKSIATIERAIGQRKKAHPA
jgi:hypothetical protein